MVKFNQQGQEAGDGFAYAAFRAFPSRNRRYRDAEPCGGYHKLYQAVLDGRLRTQQRGRQHEISRVDLPVAAQIVGVSIAADRVAA